MTLLAAGTPIRHPDTGRPEVMQRRGWWLVAIGFLLPGSAQVLAGNRRLGRFGIAMTLLLLALLAVAGLLWLVWRSALLTIVANSIGLLVIEVLLIAYAVLWLVLGFDTIRLARLPKVQGGARAAIAIVAVLATVAPAALAGYGASLVDATRGLVGNVFDFARPAVEPIDGRYTFLLLGGDAGDDRVGLRADSMTVVTVNAETGAATMIGVPRNLRNAPFSEGSPMWGPWPNGFDCESSDCLLNGTYTYGEAHPELYPDAEANGSSPGIEATRDAVEGVTGIELQFYVLVDMHGFEDLVDALGGLRLEVTQRVPIAIEGEPVREWIEPGTRVLDGHDTLWYARSRAGTSDYDRMARQRQVQEALIREFTPQTLLTKYTELSRAGQDMVQSDVPQSMIGSLSDLALQTRDLPITNLELVPPAVTTGDPDFAQIHAMVQEALAEADAIAVPTETPTPSP
ncbi:LCP family protein [Agrococcus carbonis]|uniref:Cell envelope-related function transcriptional attenuator common domain-containing protein n=1 Tax=Agrococcus carbonis TaxID=684552 RepID=A0A1H1M5Z9_9MICO|nr:LCP family protein [Agrococcus carbonis]SDR82070.1 cell envelope-related function transcriptional attenuator common domain-containing protein [Agrococcus carbonis]